MTDQKEQQRVVERILVEAGEILLSYWPGGTEKGANSPGRDLNIETKEDGSLVTQADLASNTHIGEQLRQCFPQDNIRSEEEDIQQTTPEAPLWLFDPLDGTTMFSKGGKEFAILLALIKDRTVQSGYMYFPVDKRMIIAHRGQGSFENGKEISIVAVRASDEAESLYIRGYEDPENPLLVQGRLDSQVALCKLLHGELNSVVLRMERLGDWDIAAPSLILEEAGAIVSDEQNKPLRFDNVTGKKSCTFFAASVTPELHRRSLSYCLYN